MKPSPNETQAFWNLQREVFRLHEEGKYAEALALVERVGSRFSDQANRTTYWRACLLSRLGHEETALKVLHEGVEAGHWWWERVLYQDSDLQNLRGRPGFEQLVGVCRQRQQEAQRRAKPDIVTLVPEAKPPAAGYPMLLSLHGGGSNVATFAPYWEALPNVGWLVAVPQSSQVAGKGTFHWGDRSLATGEIRDHYATLRDTFPIDGNRLVVSGFSQGGAVALWLALKRDPFGPCGFIGIGTVVQDEDSLASLVQGNAGRLRAYLIIGTRDFAYDSNLKLARTLEQGGVAVKVEERPGLWHEIPEDLDQSVKRALTFITQG